MQKNSAVSAIVAAGMIGIIVIAAAAIGFYYISSNNGRTISASGSSSTNSNNTGSSSSSSSPLILYSADAYVNESTELVNAFSCSSGVPVVPPKAGGSLALAQQIAQGSPVSVFISVSKTAVQNTTLKNASSGWAVSFATDQMGIAYSNATKSNSAATQVLSAFSTATATNTTRSWYNFYNNLTSGQVKVGISDPNADPAGYRAWIVLEAAGKVYANDTNYFVNRMLTNHGNVTGASAANLEAPLDFGQIQFLFIYKTAIESAKLNLIQLTNGVNLGSPSYNTFYSQFTYNVSSGPQRGAAIVLWITVPKTSVNPAESVQFVVFVLQNYKSILNPFGLVFISPPRIYNDSSSDIPAALQSMIAQGSLAYAGSL